MNQVTHDTSKGSVSHMKVPSEHVLRLQESAKPRWVIFPKYVPHAVTELTPRSKANSMLELGRNSFNYTVLGLAGFESLAEVITAVTVMIFNTVNWTRQSQFSTNWPHR